jgi:predicted PurR-regulated permease PerM
MQYARAMFAFQSWAQTVTIAAVLVAALIYQTRNLDKRIDDFRSEVNSRFAALDHRFDDLKDWIRAEVRRLESRIDRSEHPIVKQ